MEKKEELMVEIVQQYGRTFGSSLSAMRMFPDVPLPTKPYRRSAAWDIAAYTPKSTTTIAPKSTKMVPTGLILVPPPLHFLQVCSRSGLALKSIFVANAPGIIDPDYTGEIKVLLFNGGDQPFYCRHGDRIAQILCLPICDFPITEIFSAPETERGDKGFGSSGK